MGPISAFLTTLSASQGFQQESDGTPRVGSFEEAYCQRACFQRCKESGSGHRGLSELFLELGQIPAYSLCVFGGDYCHH